MTDDTELVRWLAPTQSSQVDQVALDELIEGWTPARVDELPIAAAIAVIRSVGIVDPVLLRPVEGGYEVVTGHRTVAAALLAMALDGTATGQLTAESAGELRSRMQAAGLGEEDIDDVMAAVPVAAPALEPALADATPEPEAVAPEAEAAEVEPEAEAPEPEAAEVEPEPEAPEPEAAEVEPQPAALEPEPEPALAEPEPAAAEPEPIPEPVAARWIPLPSGEPRLARLSSAFADSPRMLQLLAADGFTGTVELVGSDGRRDAVTFLEGECVAASVEEGGQRVRTALRLPGPERGPVVEITVRPHPPTVVVALALALRAPARLVGLDASFLHLDGLIANLHRRGRDAAVVVAAPRGAGVILLSEGKPIAAYARREGQETGEAAETTDIGAVAELLADGTGEVDVHDGPLVEPLNLAALIAEATPGA
jgi:hypothetical protein